jgi:hypothetical protein
MGDMAEYYMEYEYDFCDYETFNDEHYRSIWINYQKGKLFWTTKVGSSVSIKNMETSHIQNTINHLKNKKAGNLAIDEWLDVFQAELKSR